MKLKGSLDCIVFIAIVFAFIGFMVILLMNLYMKPLTEGEIYDKQFCPAHMETDLIYGTRLDVPDSWIISIRKFDEKNNRWRHRNIDVGQELYQSVKIGDYFKQ